jgi:hypothetical protein
MKSLPSLRAPALAAAILMLAISASASNAQTECSSVDDLRINPAGSIAGKFSTTLEPFSHGFVRVGESITTFTVEPEGIEGPGPTFVADIDPSGTIAGSYAFLGLNRGFLRFAGGDILRFDVPGADETGPMAINNSGVVTGYWDHLRTPVHDDGFIRYTDGTIVKFAVPGAAFTIPTDVNTDGVVTGRYTGGGFVRAVDGTLTTFQLGIGGTSPLGINPQGTVVGSYFDVTGERGFLRSPDGSVTTFGIPGAGSTHAAAINPAGAVTGDYQDGSGQHAFIREANGDITTFDLPGALATVAQTISPSGTVAGYASTGDRCRLGFLRTRFGVIKTFEIPAGTPSPDEIADGGGFMRGPTRTAPQSAAIDLERSGRTAGSWVIDYSLPADSDLSMAIYDVAGRRVAELERGPRSAGSHQLSWRSAGVAPGVYFLRLQAGTSRISRTIVIRN